MLRNRLFLCLVETHGYRAIAIESSFPRVRVVNYYVAGRGPASYDAVQDTGFGNGIVLPDPGPLEARLTALPGPGLFIPTHKGQGLPASEIASLPTRSGSMKNPTYIASPFKASPTSTGWLSWIKRHTTAVVRRCNSRRQPK